MIKTRFFKYPVISKTSRPNYLNTVFNHILVICIYTIWAFSHDVQVIDRVARLPPQRCGEMKIRPWGSFEGQCVKNPTPFVWLLVARHQNLSNPRGHELVSSRGAARSPITAIPVAGRAPHATFATAVRVRGFGKTS